MSKTFRKRKHKHLTLIFSAFILATMPIAIYSILSSPSFDIRQFAQVEDTKCTITIPNITTRSIQKGNTYQVLVDSNLGNERILSVEIFNKERENIFSKEYTQTTSKINETFAFTPKKLGEENLSGEIKTQNNTYQCNMTKVQSTIFVREKNYPPEFLTDPYFSAIPASNSLKIGDTYEYLVEVADRDQDNIEYHYSFTPRADWLYKTVLESGKDGKLKLKFSGTPDKKGSYLANIFVHDGHNNNISAQSWIINIGQETSEIPVRQEPRIPIIDSEFDNAVILEEPQINSVNPSENSLSKNPKETISANLIASTKATINPENMTFMLNDEDFTQELEIIKISERETLIRYTPTSNFKDGEYKAFISFTDSNNIEVEKEWFFTIELQLQDESILGLPINTAMIFGIGILLVLFAFSIPWVIYIAWKKDEIDDYEEIPIIKPD